MCKADNLTSDAALKKKEAFRKAMQKFVPHYGEPVYGVIIEFTPPKQRARRGKKVKKLA